MLPLGERPLLVRVGVHYKFSKLLVDRVEAVDGTYDVLFIGTGTDHRLVVPLESEELFSRCVQR